MKCKACKVDVSPKFVAAIAENKCPACGRDLMTEASYKRIFEVKRQISDLGFDDDMLLGIAAALTSKFALVPRELALDDDAETVESVELEEEDVVETHAATKPFALKKNANGKSPSGKPIKRIGGMQKKPSLMAEASDEEYVSPSELTTEEKQMLGLAASDVPAEIGSPEDFGELLNDVAGIELGMDPDMPAPLGGDRHSDYMARARAAKMNSGQGIRRVER